MRQHIESVAVRVDVLVRALEQAGAQSEVLGYTTGAWNGGRAQRDWLRAAARGRRDLRRRRGPGPEPLLQPPPGARIWRAR